MEAVLRSALLRKALLLLAALHLAWQLGVLVPVMWQRTDTRRDMVLYYTAARHALRGEPLYEHWPEYGPHLTPFKYFYPPQFAVVIAPLGALPFPVFSRLWYALILLAFWVYAGCLARLACGRVSLEGCLIAGLALGLLPKIYIALVLGQADPFVWVLFGLAFCLPSAGALLAVAAQIKLYTFWPLAVAGWHERQRILRPAAIALAAGMALGGLACGWGTFGEWARSVLPVVGQGTFNNDNVSLSFAVLRLARGLGWNYAGGPLPGIARFYLTVMELLGPLTVAYLTRRCERQMQTACVAAAALLFAPLCWTCYLALLLTPAALALRAFSPPPVPLPIRSYLAGEGEQNIHAPTVSPILSRAQRLRPCSPLSLAGRGVGGEGRGLRPCSPSPARYERPGRGTGGGFALLLTVAALLGFIALQYRMPEDFAGTWGVNQAGVGQFARHLFGRTLPALDRAAFALWFRVALVGLWLSYIFLLGTGLRGGVPARRTLLSLVIGVPLLVALFCPPSLSVDAYGYVKYARMQVLYGLNPYTHVPAVLKERHDPAAGYPGWNHSTPYGSLWTLLACGLVWVLRSAELWGQVVAMKLVEAGALVLAAFAGRRIAARLAPERADLTLLAIGLNPLLLLEGPGNGHNDLLMMAFLLLGVAFYLEGKYARSALCFGGSIAVKLVTVAFLPWIAWERARGKTLKEGATAVLVLLTLALTPLTLGLIPFWQGQATLTGAGFQSRAAAGVSAEMLAREAQLAERLRQQGVPAGLVPVAVSLSRQWPLMAVYIGLSAWLWRRNSVADRLTAWGVLTISPAFLMTGLWFPWYFSWSWTAALARWDRRHLCLIAACCGLSLVFSLLYTL
ncbi:MAG TPA: glycosyltransferase 87 family protein [Chthonomonadaceae bacterium]|nr:glycosyltransferase 87 family protein [Chthonomonadaceae bacterium]